MARQTKQRRTFKQFAKDKNIEISVQRYLIDALSFMASGLFASLLIGTIFNTLGQNLQEYHCLQMLSIHLQNKLQDLQ